MPFDRDQVKNAAAALARQGVFIGTSSWKYPGWKGQLYDESRYIWRGRFSEARLEKYCLTEYAQVFKTVCVDAAYYKFPDRAYLQEMITQVPADFLFAFKVTDQITIKRFANLPRHGARAGAPNPDFLNAELFETAFLGPCQEFQRNVGLLIFEFSRFYLADFERGRDFAEALDRFLERLPKGWPYGVEIRNRNFLHADYFATLARHGVVHVYNSWQDMPSLAEQMALPESRTNPRLTGARLLLRPGRKYEEAVKLFKPYNQLKEPNPEGRTATRALIRQTRSTKGNARTLIYVNNRFEGNALETISALVDENDPLIPNQ
jgi:uncharacterized protein YecE (DUF72 family)